jgi:hypothetical protein
VETNDSTTIRHALASGIHPTFSKAKNLKKIIILYLWPNLCWLDMAKAYPLHAAARKGDMMAYKGF